MLEHKTIWNLACVLWVVGCTIGCDGEPDRSYAADDGEPMGLVALALQESGAAVQAVLEVAGPVEVELVPGERRATEAPRGGNNRAKVSWRGVRFGGFSAPAKSLRVQACWSEVVPGRGGCDDFEVMATSAVGASSLLTPQLPDDRRMYISLRAVGAGPSAWTPDDKGPRAAWLAEPGPVAFFGYASSVLTHGPGILMDLAAGSGGVCGLSARGRLFCWGPVVEAAPDAAASGDAGMPRLVEGIPAVKRIAVGGGHACTVAGDGRVWCFGDSTLGQTGVMGFQWHAPTVVEGLERVHLIAAGDAFSCVRKANGTVWCWGDDSQGQLGDGETGSARATPQSAVGLDFIRNLAAGPTAACAIRGDGTLWCWGEGYGPTPALQPGFPSVTEVALGAGHVCARAGDGTVWCQGQSQFGQAGSMQPEVSQPTQVAGIEYAKAVTAGPNHTCALIGDGTARCFGRLGELGVPPSAEDAAALGEPSPVVAVTDRSTATTDGPPVPWSHLASGHRVLCGRRGDGKLSCLGRGLLMHPTTTESPPPSPGQAGVVAGIRGFIGPLGVGNFGSPGRILAVISDGSVSATGPGPLLGDGKGWDEPPGTNPASGLPVRVPDIAFALEAGGFDYLISGSKWGPLYVRTATGSVLTWGVSRFGSLGVGEPTMLADPPGLSAQLIDRPTAVLGAAFAVQITNRNTQTCWFLTAGGRMVDCSGWTAAEFTSGAASVGEPLPEAGRAIPTAGPGDILSINSPWAAAVNADGHLALPWTPPFEPEGPSISVDYEHVVQAQYASQHLRADGRFFVSPWEDDPTPGCAPNGFWSPSLLADVLPLQLSASAWIRADGVAFDFGGYYTLYWGYASPAKSDTPGAFLAISCNDKLNNVFPASPGHTSERTSATRCSVSVDGLAYCRGKRFLPDGTLIGLENAPPSEVLIP
jgi:alpha-tubulin suppressor-like RCC1 family protein